MAMDYSNDSNILVTLVYIREIQQRQKWTKTTRSFRIGDVVLIRDEINPPAKWPLGIISELHPGSDGVVRVVRLKTEKSFYTRPVVKLVLLMPLPEVPT